MNLLVTSKSIGSPKHIATYITLKESGVDLSVGIEAAPVAKGLTAVVAFKFSLLSIEQNC